MVLALTPRRLKVHSLANLNSYSGQNITFSDDRPIDIKYLFAETINKSITINEDSTHPAQLGNEVTEFVNCGTGNVVYRINVAAVANTTVTWGTLPSGITSNVTAGVYTLSGLRFVKDWDQIKAPTITMPVDYNGVWTYTSSLLLDGNVDTSWTTTVTVNKVDNLSQPSVFYYTAGNTEIITGTPIVQDLSSNSYTLTTTVSNPSYVANLTVSGTGGNVTSNTTTKTITITASRIQINNYLANLTLTTDSLTDADFNLNYSLLNPVSSTYSNVSQNISSLTGNILTRGNASYYNEDTITNIQNVPTINNPLADVGQNYLLRITPTTSNCVSNLFTTSTFSNVSWYSGNVTLELFGTKVNTNKDLGNLYMTPFTDKDEDFVLNYKLFDSGTEISSRNQDQLIDSVNDEIDNIELSRTFVQNTIGLLFTANIPVINETPPGTPSYTISFTSAAGKFGLNDNSVVDTYSFTGTKAECNAIYPLLRFYPNKDVLGNQTFNYSQSRAGIAQVSISVPIIGSARTAPYPDVTYTFTSTETFTPSYTEAVYLTKDILVVGGGGGGSFKGGGGGGGQVTQLSSVTAGFAIGATNIIVGAGGVGSDQLVNPGQPGGTSNAFGYIGLGGSPGTATGVGGASGGGSLGGAKGSDYNDGIGRTFAAGGGGGGSIAGNAGVSTTGGNGAPGSLSALTSNYYGGGGGGGGANSSFSATGGIGGAGNGGSYVNLPTGTSATSANVNTGSGGGGGNPFGVAGNGGSGIVVLRFYR
jgi:hypothetical protein